MRTGTRSLHGTGLALPLSVLGGTAIVATALAWSRRRSNRERSRQEAAESEGNAESKNREPIAPVDRELAELESPGLMELESNELPDDGEGGLDALSFGERSESLAGESYDSVNPDDAGREWLLRATETQAPLREEPESIDDLVIVSLAQEDDSGIDDLVARQAAPPGFFQEDESLQEEVDLKEDVDFQEEVDLEDEDVLQEEVDFQEDDLLDDEEKPRKY